MEVSAAEAGWTGPGRLGWKRLQHHVYCVASTGAGKSTLMRNAAVQLQRASREGVFPCSVWFIDPKGDDSLKLLQELETLENVVFLDPLRGFSVNPFELPQGYPPEQRDWLVSQYIGYIMTILQEWYGSSLESAPRMFRIMEALVRYLYHESDAPTWIDLHDLVLRLRSGEKEQVQPVLARISEVLGRFQAEELRKALESIAGMKGEAFDPVLHRIEKFATDPFLKRLFSVRRSTVDFMERLQPGAVTVVRCAHMGEHIRGLIMSSIVLKLWFTVQFRAAVRPEEQRVPAVLFIDEFQELQSLGILRTLLAQARSFKLVLWLSHQNLSQLDEELLKTVLGNTAVQVAGPVSGEDARRLARHWDPQFAAEIEQALVTMPFYTFMVRERSFSGEQQPPRMVRALPPPPEKRSGREAEAWLKLEAGRLAAAPPEPSIFAAAPSMAKWTRFIPLPRLPSSLEWKLFLGFRHVKTASYTRICELTGADRSDQRVKGAFEKLYTELKVTTVRSTDQAGKPTSWAPTKLGQSYLNPEFSMIGGEEAQAIAAKAWRYYIDQGVFCCVAPQDLEEEARPDLVAYDYKRGKAVSVEVESGSECQTHKEQIRRNMEKWADLGFQECHVWFPREWGAELKRLLETLPEQVRLGVRLFPV